MSLEEVVEKNMRIHKSLPASSAIEEVKVARMLVVEKEGQLRMEAITRWIKLLLKEEGNIELPLQMRFATVESEQVMVDEIPFPPEIIQTKPLSLLGHGITDIEIQFLQIKFTAIGVYLDPEIVNHLQKWKGRKGPELAGDDEFFDAVISAPVDKFLRIVVIKEIKGSQYGSQLECAVKDRLAAEDKYEDEEEETLEKVLEFLQFKYFFKNSVLTYYFPASSPSTAEMRFKTEGKEEMKLKVENANVVEMMKKWYMGGSSGVSQTTISSLAEGLSLQLSN